MSEITLSTGRVVQFGLNARKSHKLDISYGALDNAAFPTEEEKLEAVTKMNDALHPTEETP